MPHLDLSHVKDLDSSFVELLEAVGITGVNELASGEPSRLHQEMVDANGHLGLCPQAPTNELVFEWVKNACALLGKPTPVLGSAPSEVAAAYSKVEVLDAITVEKEAFIDLSISVEEVPEMTDFVDVESLQQVAVVEEVVAPREVNPPVEWVEPEPEPRADVSPTPRFDKSNPMTGQLLRTDSDKAELAERKVKPLVTKREFDERTMASENLNEGRKLHSRSFIRGVLHNQPWKVRLGALYSLMSLLFLPLSFASLILITLKIQVGPFPYFWWAIVPLALLIWGFLYLVVARPMKCRICGQPLFASKRCGRHKKAHRLLFLGYIFPLSLHLLIFHWFRCSYCGTSVRLKK